MFQVEGLTVRYDGYAAVRDVTFDVQERAVTAFIGPSGCGKTTILRTLNRMNDLVPGATVEGSVRFLGTDLYAPERRSRRGAAAHRHGLPAAQSVPALDPRQRSVRARARSA